MDQNTLYLDYKKKCKPFDGQGNNIHNQNYNNCTRLQALNVPITDDRYRQNYQKYLDCSEARSLYTQQIMNGIFQGNAEDPYNIGHLARTSTMLRSAYSCLNVYTTYNNNNYTYVDLFLNRRDEHYNELYYMSQNGSKNIKSISKLLLNYKRDSGMNYEKANSELTTLLLKYQTIFDENELATLSKLEESKEVNCYLLNPFLESELTIDEFKQMQSFFYDNFKEYDKFCAIISEANQEILKKYRKISYDSFLDYIRGETGFNILRFIYIRIFGFRKIKVNYVERIIDSFFIIEKERGIQDIDYFAFIFRIKSPRLISNVNDAIQVKKLETFIIEKSDRSRFEVLIINTLSQFISDVPANQFNFFKNKIIPIAIENYKAKIKLEKDLNTQRTKQGRKDETKIRKLVSDIKSKEEYFKKENLKMELERIKKKFKFDPQLNFLHYLDSTEFYNKYKCNYIDYSQFVIIVIANEDIVEKDKTNVHGSLQIQQMIIPQIQPSISKEDSKEDSKEELPSDAAAAQGIKQSKNKNQIKRGSRVSRGSRGVTKKRVSRGSKGSRKSKRGSKI